MKVLNHKDYACMEYEHEVKTDVFNLGDIVTRVSEDGVEIGVIIQLHGNNEYRVDMFGNCHGDDITLTTADEMIKQLRSKK